MVSTLVVSWETPGPIHVAPNPTAPPTVREAETYDATRGSGMPFCKVHTTL